MGTMRELTAAARAVRVDLAAAFRMAVRLDLHEGVCNHFSAMLNGKTFLLNRYGLHWSEVSASNLIALDAAGRILEGEGEVEKTAFHIHSRIHLAHPRAACVLHTHMPYASALARLEEQEILAIGQTEIGLLDKIAYDYEYTGPALDPAEGERLAGIIGPERKILFMANHGICVCGGSVAEAYDLLYYLERAAQVQLYAMWTGRRLRQVKPEVVSRTLTLYDQTWPDYQGAPPYQHHFDALKRLLDRKEPDYAD